MSVKAFLAAMGRIAPLHLAEKWDNVGLLVEPTTPRPLKRIFLTNDLTEPVMQEAIDWKADCVIAYHPPIFVPLKRLTQKDTKQRIVIQAIEHGIAIYSPHTAADTASMGVNEWLIEGLGVGTTEFKPIVVKCAMPNHKLVVTGLPADAPVLEKMLSDAGATIDSCYTQQPWGVPKDSATSKVRFEAVVTDQQKTEILGAIGPLRATVDLYPLAAEPLAVGCGRVAAFQTPIRLSEVVQRIKAHLGLAFVRVAHAEGRPGQTVEEDPQIRSVGVCAGSGADWLKTCDADLVWTGELSHHDVLACVASGKCVVLCDHSNTERGWLRDLAQRLKTELADIETKCSSVDADPLKVV